MLVRPGRNVCLAALLTTAAAWSAAPPLYVSPAGSDNAPGTREAPLKTISKGVALAVPGQTVNVLAGVYNEQVTLPRSGEPDNPITLAAAERAVIQQNDKTTNKGICGYETSWWIIGGFEIAGTGQGVKFRNGRNIVVRQCRIHDCGVGVSLEGTMAADLTFENVDSFANTAGGFDVSEHVALTNVTFRRCRAYDNLCDGGTDGFGISHNCIAENVLFDACQAYGNASDGFDLSGTANEVEVRNCIAHHNGQTHGAVTWGCNFKSWNAMTFVNCVAWVTGPAADPNFGLSGGPVTLVNCTSGQHPTTGIITSESVTTDVTLVNCLLADSAHHAVVIYGPGSLTASHCLAYDGGGDAGSLRIGANGNVWADPRFVDAAGFDYHLRAGSAAIGAGVADPRATTDADGRPRPAIPSIGAYEYAAPPFLLMLARTSPAAAGRRRGGTAMSAAADAAEVP